MPNGVEFCSATQGLRETDEEENGRKRTQRTQKGMQKAQTVTGAGHREPFRHHSQKASNGRNASFFASFAFFRGHPPRWSGQFNHLHSSGFALQGGAVTPAVFRRLGKLFSPPDSSFRTFSSFCLGQSSLIPSGPLTKLARHEFRRLRSAQHRGGGTQADLAESDGDREVLHQ